MVVGLADDLRETELATPPPHEPVSSGQKIFARCHAGPHFAFVVDVVRLPVVDELAGFA